MPRPTPMGIRHEVFALAREGIKQGAIAARVGLTRAIGLYYGFLQDECEVWITFWY